MDAAAQGAGGAPTALERCELFLELLRGGGNYDESVLDGLEVLEAAPGRVVCRLPAAPKHANRGLVAANRGYGTMHGGCIATLVDVIGSAAIITQSDRSGVSLSITTHYLSPMPVGEVVEIESTVAKVGKQIATAVVNLRNVATGSPVAQGTHVKALVPHSDMGALISKMAKEAQAQQGGSGAGARAETGPPRSRL